MGTPSDCQACGLRASRDEDELLAAASAGLVARTVTHDLNNLFTCILVTAMAPSRGDGDGARRLSAIQQAVQRGAELLDLLREVTGETAEPRAAVVDVLGPCGVLLDRVGARAGVEVIVTTTDAIVAIAPRELQQIVINLGLNAIDAMTDGGGRLELGVERDASRVNLIVTDTGPGMPAGEVDALFAAGRTTKPGHTGLGLAIVRQLVERAGGAVEVDTAPGRGTRFRIRLPAAESAP